MTLPNQKLIKFGPDYTLSIVDEQHHSEKYELAVIYKENLVHMHPIYSSMRLELSLRQST